MTSHIIDLVRAARALAERLPKAPAPSKPKITITAEVLRAMIEAKSETLH